MGPGEPPTRAGADPAIAVIVAAYRRRSFLDEAIRSVREQGLGPAELELVVLTDAEDPELDATLAREGGRHRVDPEPVIGRWWLKAIDRVRAPLVAVLEDDDRFRPGRLRRALERFRADPDLVYYRNRVSVIDRDGAPVPFARWDALARDRGFDGTGPLAIAADRKEEGIRRMRSIGTEWFNASTMVFRRSILTAPVRDLVRESICPDLFVFVAATLAPGSLYLDDVRSTEYRHTESSASRSPGWKRRHWEDHARWAGYARGRPPRALGEWLDERTRLLGRVVRARAALAPVRAGAPGPAARTECRRFLGELLEDHPFAPPRAVRWGTAAVSSTYAIAPRVGGRLLAQLERRFDLP